MQNSTTSVPKRTPVVNPHKRSHSERGIERRQVKLFWQRAEQYREQNLLAARIITATDQSIESFGGRYGGLVQWARMTLRREETRLNRMRARQVAA